MFDQIDERPAVTAAKLARDPEHQRWLTAVGSAMSGGQSSPVPFSTVATLALLLLALVAASALAG